MRLQRQRSRVRLRRPGRRCGKPVTVSFSGLDGAGKSFQIDALLARLGDERRVEVIWVPLMFWPPSWIHVIPPQIRRRLRPKHKGVEYTPQRSKRRRDTRGDQAARSADGGRGAKVARVLRTGPWIVPGTVVATSIGLSLRQRASSSTADILVLDRYRLDSAVKLQWMFPGVAQWWLPYIVRLLAPRPDLEVLLRVDPRVAHTRKREWSVRELTEHAQLYDKLASRSRTLVTLDAEQNPEVIAKEIWSRVRPLLDRGGEAEPLLSEGEEAVSV